MSGLVPMRNAMRALLLLSCTLAGCDGRPLLYQVLPSDYDVACAEAFRMIDTGNSGRLSRADVDDYFRRRFAELDRNRDGFLDEEEARGIVPILGKKTGRDLVFHLDLDGDGKLSLEEFLRLSNYLFTRDENGDGVLTLEEVKKPPLDHAIPSDKASIKAGGPPQ